ncbi:hypothetical protein [Jeotgalicoccus sp. FSL K6-3177]|uniref:hypothetical protein n=1 Tax=Jeotgalicoccus sp. FSL K6-3177 TaxID=2921494 RepID=UPI0030FDE4C7
MKRLLLGTALSTALLLAACGGETEDTETDTSTTEEETETTEVEDTEEVVEEETETVDENLTTGDTVEMDGVEFTLDGAYYTDERNEFAEVEADSVVILDISFTNNTGQDYSPTFDMSVYADGSKAEEYPVGDVVLDVVSDGRSSSGSIAYALVGEPSEIELEFAPMMSFSGEKSIYTVTPE